MPGYPIQGEPIHSDKLFSVYLHRNLVNNKVYVGQTSLPLQKRWGKNGSGYSKQSLFWSAIQKYGWENFEHTVLEENVPENLIDEREKYYISLYHSSDSVYGYNILDGGQSNHSQSQETRKKISKSLKEYAASEQGIQQSKKHSVQMSGTNNPMYGKKHSEETKQKMRESKLGDKNPNYGKTFTQEHRDKISQALSGKNHYNYGVTGIDNASSKQVYCVELSRSFGSITEASEYTGIDKSSIAKCCRGTRKTAGKIGNIPAHWRYATDEEVKRLKGES